MGEFLGNQAMNLSRVPFLEKHFYTYYLTYYAELHTSPERDMTSTHFPRHLSVPQGRGNRLRPGDESRGKRCAKKGKAIYSVYYNRKLMCNILQGFAYNTLLRHRFLTSPSPL